MSTIFYDDKKRIQDLDELNSFNISSVFIDITNKEKTLSLKTGISSFEKQNGYLNEAAARRYRTETNNLLSEDLHLFSKYEQTGQNNKEVYFEEFPIVDAEPPLSNNQIKPTQLLTKSNLLDFESYLTKKHLTSYSCIPAYNWENETEYQMIESFKDLIKDNKNDSRATYKFEYTTLSPHKNNIDRVTNVVPLNQFKIGNSTISSVVHYTVAGIVSVKSDLEDQRSGTIYLEAREAGNKKAKWQTIDSAVFKFLPNKKVNGYSYFSPGTYITLSGYLSTNFETRLKLNLKSQGYSMNMYQFRDENYALTNHYVNTFLGFVHIPDATSTPATKAFLTNINYQSYLYHGNGFLLKEYQFLNNATTKNFPSVRTLLGENGFKLQPDEKCLEISSEKMVLTNPNNKNFIINGVRASPTGEISGLDHPINVEVGMTLYPSYASGVVEAIKPQAYTYEVNKYPSRFSLNKRNILNEIKYTELSVLPNLGWNKQTEILGEISTTIWAMNDTRGIEKVDGFEDDDEHVIGTLSFTGIWSAADYATDKPRRKYKGKEYEFDFSTYLKDKNVDDDTLITCKMHIYPKTWGKGSGSESFGRILDGNRKIVNEKILKTKNISKEFTFGLCTGSRWNYKEQASDIEFTQPCDKQSFFIYAAADAAINDGKKETWFGVFVTDVEIKYKHTVISAKPVKKDQEVGKITYYTGRLDEIVECSVDPVFSIPSNITSQVMTVIPHDTEVSDFQLSTVFQNITAQNMNFTKSKNSSYENDYTTLTVKPYPENLVL